MHPLWRSSALVFAIVLVAAACSGGSETGESATTGDVLTETTADPLPDTDPSPDTEPSPDTDPASDSTGIDADTTTTTTVTTAPQQTADPTTAPSSAVSTVASSTSSTVATPTGDPDFSQPSDDPLIEAITQRYVDEAGIGDPQATEAEFRCVSTRLIDDVGLRAILEASVSESGESDFDPATLDEADQDIVVDAMSTCLDLEAMLQADLVGDGTMTEDQAACFAEEIADRGLFERLIRPIVLGQATGSDGPDAETRAALSEAALGCIDLVEQMAAEFAADGTLSETSARCLAEGMEAEGLLETLLAEALSADTGPSNDTAPSNETGPSNEIANQAAFIEIARGCLTTAEFTAISE